MPCSWIDLERSIRVRCTLHCHFIWHYLQIRWNHIRTHAAAIVSDRHVLPHAIGFERPSAVDESPKVESTSLLLGTVDLSDLAERSTSRRREALQCELTTSRSGSNEVEQFLEFLRIEAARQEEPMNEPAARPGSPYGFLGSHERWMRDLGQPAVVRGSRPSARVRHEEFVDLVDRTLLLRHQRLDLPDVELWFVGRGRSLGGGLLLDGARKRLAR